MSFSVDKALKSKVVLLGGEEELLLRRSVKELLAQVAPEGDDFDLMTLDADAASPEEWFAAAGTAPFLAERRTCVVRRLLRCDEPERLALKALPDYALLILVADDEGGDELKRRKQQTLRAKWQKHVTAASGYSHFFESDGKSLPSLLRKEAQDLGAALTPGAASLLAEMVGGSLSRGLGELEKLAVYAEPGTQISEKVVREVVVPSREWNIFRLVECVVAGDVAGAFQQLQILVVSPTKADDAAHGSVLPMMHRQLRFMWQARILVEAKASVDNVPDWVKSQLPDRPSILKEPPYRLGKLMSFARQISFATLTNCLQILSDADAKLKGMLPASSAMETLEQTLLLLTRELKPAAVA